jgi:predicted nuclease of predicted toxin-antitoxin system
MRLLIDQNVPDSVARFLEERCHQVLLVRETLGRASPDQLIAVTAALQGVVVVTFDKDFRRFQRLLPDGVCFIAADTEAATTAPASGTSGRTRVSASNGQTP